MRTPEYCATHSNDHYEVVALFRDAPAHGFLLGEDLPDRLWLDVAQPLAQAMSELLVIEEQEQLLYLGTYTTDVARTSLSMEHLGRGQYHLFRRARSAPCKTSDEAPKNRPHLTIELGLLFVQGAASRPEPVLTR
jgi:hypothetical protein